MGSLFLQQSNIFLIVMMLLCHLYVSILQISSDESVETAKQLALQEGLLVCVVCLLPGLYLWLIQCVCSCTWPLGYVDSNAGIRSHDHTLCPIAQSFFPGQRKKKKMQFSSRSSLLLLHLCKSSIIQLCMWYPHSLIHVFPFYLRKVNVNIWRLQAPTCSTSTWISNFSVMPWWNSWIQKNYMICITCLYEEYSWLWLKFMEEFLWDNHAAGLLVMWMSYADPCSRLRSLLHEKW